MGEIRARGKAFGLSTVAEITLFALIGPAVARPLLAADLIELGPVDGGRSDANLELEELSDDGNRED